MVTDIRLSVGDGDVTDDLALDGVTGYGVVQGSFSAPPAEPGARYRVITWAEEIKGSAGDDLWAKVGAIQTKLTQAAQAAGAYGHGSRVTLSMKLADASNYVYADIVSGFIDIPPENFTAPLVDGTWLPQIFVSLLCEPYLRGAAVTTTVSGTITATAGTFATPGNTGSGGLFVASIPGDVPALVRHTITDVSTSSKYINRLRIGAFSLPDPAAAIAQSAYTPWIDATAYGGGTSTAGADAVGGFYSRLNLSSTIQAITRDTKPAGAYNTGLFDVWARVRDSNTILGAPTLTAAGVDNDANMFVRQAIPVSTTGATTLTPTWGSTTRAGSTLLIGVAIESRTITITTPTDYTASSAAVAHPSSDERVAWFFIENSAARSGAETVTFSSSVAGSVVMYEIVGAPHSATVIDIEVTGTTTATSPLTIATGTMAQSHTMVFGIAQWGTGTMGAINGTLTDFTAVVADSTRDFQAGYARSTSTLTRNFIFNVSASDGNSAGAIIGVRQAQNLAPAIPTGTYDVCVVAADASAASFSPPSNTIAVTVTQTDCVIYAEWTPGSGTADHYRIYYRISGGSWEYYASAAATGSITAYTIADDGGTVGDPPSNPNTSLVYLLVALSPSGAQTFFTKPVSPVIGGGNWEWLYLGMVPLPPMPASDGSAPRDWVAGVSAKNIEGTGTFDVDALALMQHPVPSADNRHFVDVKYKNDDLAALRRWNIETRRDGRTFAYLSEVGGDTEAGQLTAIGESLGGPGDTWFTAIPDVASSISDVVDCKLTWAITYTPRFVYLRGT